MREREDANRTREARNRDEVEGVVANTLNLFRHGAVGFIEWLDPLRDNLTDAVLGRLLSCAESPRSDSARHDARQQQTAER